jgi:hypothetical protein
MLVGHCFLGARHCWINFWIKWDRGFPNKDNFGLQVTTHFAMAWIALAFRLAMAILEGLPL